VGRCTERKVGVAEEPVIGDDAVSGGVDVGEVRAHSAIDVDCAFGAEGGAGGEQLGGGTHSDDHEHEVCLLDLRDREAAQREGVGHPESDVAGADDDRARRLTFLKGAHERERVVHRVEDVDAVVRARLREAVDGWSDGHGPRRDDQLVVGDPADRVVRIGVLDEDGDVGRGGELESAECGADPGVASSDDQQAVHASRARAC
jgi:hypothetical protein